MRNLKKSSVELNLKDLLYLLFVEFDHKCQLASDIFALQDRLSCIMRKGGKTNE